MRARRERAVAHEAALRLAAASLDADIVLVKFWAARVVEFTKPRRWWWFW